MSMADDLEALRQMKQDADMADAVESLARIRLVIEHVIMSGEIALGLDHLGMYAINDAAGEVQGGIDILHERLLQFGNKVKDVADSVIQSLENPPSS